VLHLSFHHRQTSARRFERASRRRSLIALLRAYKPESNRISDATAHSTGLKALGVLCRNF
jgi:hypothetical protein